MPPRESVFEAALVRKIEKLFPGAVTLKINPNYIQGFPDRLTLVDDSWFAFETKVSLHASHRPNQEYYIRMLDEMSYASFVAPENEQEFLDEIQRTFRFARPPRVSRR